LQDIAGWVAPIATMLAAMMTAANLGARLTGWGFVVFTGGSIAWTIVGATTGQTNLVASNGFLTLINLFGIWRWLGRQAAYEQGGQSAQVASRQSDTDSLFTATSISGMAVSAADGKYLGHAVEALMECKSGTVSYIVVATGGLGGVDEQLRAVSRSDIAFSCDGLKLRIDSSAFRKLEVLQPGRWPAAI